jgi:regulator of protease activity HflC (stomatin/prohibitin superfamily)
MELGSALLVLVAALAVLAVILIAMSVKIVPQWAKLVVYRWGQTGPKRIYEPGLRILIPRVDRGFYIDLREQFIEVPRQTAITKDNAPLGVDFLIYWKIVDPLMSQINVANFAGALQGVAATSLRSVIGDIVLDEVLSQRERINETLRLKLDEVTERWGGKVTTVEIREILPPPAVQEAMNRQLSAERTRRAVITESEGTRQATINVAEGDKQSAILRAEGDRQAAILRAQGFSAALRTIFEAAHGIDQKTMTLQYLDALKSLGTGPATKFVIPLEFTQFMGPIGSMIQSGLKSGGEEPKP